MTTVSTIAAVIEAAREGALPGREAAMINAVLRAAGAIASLHWTGDLYRGLAGGFRGSCPRSGSRMLNQRFGSWTVIQLDGRRALCRCTCGNIRAIDADSLRAGATANSCGCTPPTEALQAAIREQRRQRGVAKP
jgi:hypothetical protein